MPLYIYAFDILSNTPKFAAFVKEHFFLRIDLKQHKLHIYSFEKCNFEFIASTIRTIERLFSKLINVISTRFDRIIQIETCRRKMLSFNLNIEHNTVSIR